MRVKICGITNAEDAVMAADSGADAVGFVLYPESPRAVDPADVKRMIAKLPPFVTTVGVFANTDEGEVGRIAEQCGLDVIQLQGDETPDYCLRLGPRVFKAVRIHDLSSVKTMPRYKVRAFILDTYRKEAMGGTGKTFDWNLAIEARKFGRIVLAGGLTPSNVRRAIDLVRPAAVDVSSGVEEKIGKKDPNKTRQFIEEAKMAFRLQLTTREA
jgi:phosphoribosylanthranilate isomerase